MRARLLSFLIIGFLGFTSDVLPWQVWSGTQLLLSSPVIPKQSQFENHWSRPTLHPKQESFSLTWKVSCLPFALFGCVFLLVATRLPTWQPLFGFHWYLVSYAWLIPVFPNFPSFDQVSAFQSIYRVSLALLLHGPNSHVTAMSAESQEVQFILLFQFW